MSKFTINGGRKLSGEIPVMGAKNAALKILAASMLSQKPIKITNCPNIEEVNRILELMEHLGSVYEWNADTLSVHTEKIKTTDMDANLVQKIRASVLLIGPMLARVGAVKMPHPGGCAIGKRPIDLFVDGFKKFGAEVKEDHSGYSFKVKKRLQGMTYVFPKISVTVTEALMMTATLAEGTTILKNAACEPEIPALAEYLNKVGAKITGAGTHTITIEGVPELGGDTYEVLPDRIEAGSFAILGALTGSDLRVTHCRPDHLEALWTVFDKMGVEYQLGEDYIHVHGGGKLKAVNIQTHEYPGFPTDLQAPMTVLLTQSEGLSMVFETIFESRLFYTDMLNQMGAKIVMCDPHRVLVSGGCPLYGRRLISPDLRAGFAMVLAALIAEGETELENIYQIDRGYSNIEKRLQKVGADIKRVVD